MPFDDRGQTGTMRRSEWDRRIRRAADLAERQSPAAEVLTFYRQILEFQSTIYREASEQSAAVDTAIGLRQQLDTRLCGRYWPALLKLVQHSGTKKLKQNAEALEQVTPEQRHDMLEAFLSSAQPEPNSFFARVSYPAICRISSGSLSFAAAGLRRTRLSDLRGTTASCGASS